MDKYELIRKIESFAPIDTQEAWDCSGWLVESEKIDVNKVMLALTITDDVFNQAQTQNCDMIISHHPLFTVPIKYRGINMYCAHTNMDLADGGTTDSLICNMEKYGLQANNIIKPEGFVRYVETDITSDELLNILYKISKNLRYTNIQSKKEFKKIALCAGSGSEFINEAFENDADCFITGDLKFHTALDSPLPVFDIGHFESEIQVLGVFASLIGEKVEIVYAKEETPFVIYR
ncbi:MAG: Nif3-like dinuclear metal center hexameric protein [Candidatus Gastranaerophilaceae bacterium]|nr:Nif3-like dinuclear metal center hexameric protein [Candidatus Gastranaerophilaceae bacterium]